MDIDLLYIFSPVLKEKVPQKGGNKKIQQQERRKNDLLAAAADADESSDDEREPLYMGSDNFMLARKRNSLDDDDDDEGDLDFSSGSKTAATDDGETMATLSTAEVTSSDEQRAHDEEAARLAAEEAARLVTQQEAHRLQPSNQTQPNEGMAEAILLTTQQFNVSS